MARLSTVYDLASLRLHPDGTRVKQSSDNHKLRISRTAIRDARGNWIAQDAGGRAAVPHRKKVRDDSPGDQWEDFTKEMLDADQGINETEERPQERKRKRRKDARPTKRRKFNEDYSFLDQPQAESTHAMGDISQVQGSPLPLPSSDLLKCIHRFAAVYYTNHGQLLNSSKIYRKEKKARRLKRLESKLSNSRTGTPFTQNSYDHQSDEVDSEVNENDSEQENLNTKGGRTPGKGKERYPTDMYKVFDGSALMALAMLVQESVVQFLEPPIPEGWEDRGPDYAEEDEEEESWDESADMDPEMNEVLVASDEEFDEDGESDGEDGGQDGRDGKNDGLLGYQEVEGGMSDQGSSEEHGEDSDDIDDSTS